MIDGLVNAVIAISLVLAGWCAVTVFRDRPIGMSHLAGAAVLELALLVQAVVAFVELVGGERPGQLGTFIGYLVGSVVAPPIGAFLGLAERTRWGSGVLGVIFLVIPVLVVRLQQIWDGTVV